jgi:phage replication O-like protein O
MLKALIKTNLSPYEWRILLVVISWSWGWRRSICYLSYREIANETQIDLRHVGRAIKSLVEKQILITGSSTKKTKFEVNYQYHTWRDSPRSSGRKQVDLPLSGVADTGNGRVASPGNDSVADTGNGRVASPGNDSVADTGNGDPAETISPLEFAEFLKKL